MRSCAELADFCLQSIPNRSSRLAQFCESGSAVFVAEFPVAAQEAMHGIGMSSGPEFRVRLRACAVTQAKECVRLAPNIPARARFGDGAIVGSILVHRLATRGLRNQHRGGQSDRPASEIRNPRACHWMSHRV